MSVPIMPSTLVSREYLRIAGGFGSAAKGASPAGGLDVDNAGNLAADGDITAAGNIDVRGGELKNSTGDLVLDAQNANADSTISLRNSDGTYVANVDIEGDLNVQGGDVTCDIASIVLRTDATDKDVWLQADGTGKVFLNRFGGTGGTHFGDGGSGVVAIMSSGGNLIVDGHLAADGGDVVAGTDGGTRGVVTAWDGSGGSAPGCVKLGSPNGTVRYLFVEDDGTLKVHSSLPTQNSDGSVVGTQT